MDGHDWVAAAACANGVASTAVLIAAGVQIDVLDPKRFHVYRSMVFDVTTAAGRIAACAYTATEPTQTDLTTVTARPPQKV